MDLFISTDVTNLNYVSGAKDPIELMTGIKGVTFFDQVWRINSISTTYTNFKLRLGGHFTNTHPSNIYGTDSKG